MQQQQLSGWARTYILSVAACGVAAIAYSAIALLRDPIDWRWTLLALFTLITGSATVRLPSVPATISISETFVFASVLLFGPAAGTLTVALDALVISVWLAWRGHAVYRLVFNVTALPLALWVGATLYYLIADVPPLHSVAHAVEITRLLLPLTVFTAVYFLLNSGMIAVAISLEKRLPTLSVWRKNFAWLSLNYLGGASLAALLVSYTRNIDYAYVAVLPLLVILYFTFAMSMGRVRDAHTHLAELNKLYMSTIETLAMAIDAKDQITHGHIRRVQHYAVKLAERLGVTDSTQISAIEAASLLHDMGKLAIPEYILNKPGRLTPAEFEKMKLHASVGADILSAIPFPYPVVPIVRHHHENWDGTGYPAGLEGTAIPIGARILSVVDCFDALTSDRPYRPRLSNAEALQILLQRRGSMYDPLVVDTFINVHADIAPEEGSHEIPRDGLSAITRGATIAPSEQTRGTSFDNIASSTEEMLVLYDLARALTAPFGVGEVAGVVFTHLRRLVPASTAVLYVYDPQLDELIAVEAYGEHSSHFLGLRVVRGQRLSGWVAANERTIINSDPVLDLREAGRSLLPRLRSCLSTPLMIGNSLVGVLSLYSVTKDFFSEDHARIVEVVARQAAQAVKNAVDAERQRPTDSGAHRGRLPAETRTQFGTSALSIIFLEAQFSRTFGPRQADEEFAAFADLVKPALRSGDILFRHGSTELVVLLAQTDADAASTVAQRIASQLIHGEREGMGVERRVVLGQATAPVDGTRLELLVEAARRRVQPLSGSNLPGSVH